jgi:hypothetical protein
MQDEWYGKTVRLYITKIQKCDFDGNPWEERFILMARKQFENIVDRGDGTPRVTFFKDVAMSDEFKSIAELTGTLVSIVKNVQHRYPPGNRVSDHEFLDLLKLSRTDTLDVEMAKEKAESEGNPLVKLCLCKKDEQDCDAYEDEYAMQMDMLDPYRASEPSYREART